MLPDHYLFNHRQIRSFTAYECVVDDASVEKEVSFHVDLGPHTEGRGDVFAVYEVPDGKTVWLSDWSFNGGWIPTRQLSIGGSLGRITPSGHYIYVLNVAVYSGFQEMYSPARPIRYLAGEWMAVCFHHQGLPMDIKARTTFRFTELTEPKRCRTRVADWTARSPGEEFDGEKLVWQDGDLPSPATG